MLISIHIPKCAGTSFRHVLQQAYGQRLYLNYGGIFSREQSRPGLIPPATECVHGHFLADALDDLVENATYLTWLRHPVERVVSNYFHFLRNPDLRDTCCRALYENNLSLREFAELDWMRNEATRYLSSTSLADMEFIGVAERFGESMKICAEQFGWAHLREMPRENTNPDRAMPSYDLSDQDFNYILALNGADFASYLTAVTSLDQALRRRVICVA